MEGVTQAVQWLESLPRSIDVPQLVTAYEELVHEGYVFMDYAFGYFDVPSMVLRVLTVVIGLAALFFGGSLFRLFRTVPGFALGLWGANQLLYTLEHSKTYRATPMTEAVLLVLLPCVTALYFHYWSRQAIRTAGAVLTAYAVNVFAPSQLSRTTQYAVVAVGALVGSVLASSLFPVLLVPITVLFGAFAITWGTTARDGAIVLGLALIGSSIQFAQLWGGRHRRQHHAPAAKTHTE